MQDSSLCFASAAAAVVRFMRDVEWLLASVHPFQSRPLFDLPPGALFYARSSDVSSAHAPIRNLLSCTAGRSWRAGISTPSINPMNEPRTDRQRTGCGPPRTLRALSCAIDIRVYGKSILTVSEG
jgi:hypothetical protein